MRVERLFKSSKVQEWKPEFELLKPLEPLNFKILHQMMYAGGGSQGRQDGSKDADGGLEDELPEFLLGIRVGFRVFGSHDGLLWSE